MLDRPARVSVVEALANAPENPARRRRSMIGIFESENESSLDRRCSLLWQSDEIANIFFKKAKNDENTKQRTSDSTRVTTSPPDADLALDFSSLSEASSDVNAFRQSV